MTIHIKERIEKKSNVTLQVATNLLKIIFFLKKYKCSSLLLNSVLFFYKVWTVYRI